ncbi:ActS/PrrB/RegB family redox-sensitive histidine kinase [Caulobacter sp. 73W]|uniref:histidine kinase n=1 Tax=Caulobacter sp. 73W TaxID=3161137 RepID=A0AB39KMN7_9CAUL
MARGLDRPGTDPAQAEARGGQGRALRNGLRARTLIGLRWLAVVGQTIVLLVAGLVLDFKVPFALCFALIALAAWLNVLLMIAAGGQRQVRDSEATAQLAFDILQMTAMLFLTGGGANPFALLLAAPATLAAATLPARYALGLAGLAVAMTIALAFSPFPVPWGPEMASQEPTLLFMVVVTTARVLGIIFTAGYAWYAAAENVRMQLALDVTQRVLAREQRLSALGALAAAAAHELGTPLATITVVAREMARGTTDPVTREDAELMIAQAQRCREILQRLGETPETGDAVHERMSLLQFVQETIEPHLSVGGVRVEAVVTGGPGAAPDIWRMPEVVHAMTSIVENAVDFAKSEVLVTARFDDRSVLVEVRDDGPGFSPEILAKLGEPYITSRPGAEGGRTGHVGMGLGFFIAKTLLERTGAVVDFRNGRQLGAVVAARWPRAVVEAPNLAETLRGA